MTASAFSLSLAVPTEGFAVTAGQPVIGGLHGATRHFFCPRCKSWMFTRPEGLDQLVNVRAPTLDEHGWFQPFVEFWTEEKLPWTATPAVHSFATVPGQSEFPRLIEEYRVRGARPGRAQQ
jgi:hypothetical protein